MKKPIFFAGALLLFPTLAWSQPDPGNAPKIENPPNRAPGGRGARRNLRNITPAQRQQWEAQRLEARTRQLLRAAGFTDAPLQDAVLAFVKEQQSAQTELQTKLRAISQALRANVVTDAQLAALVNDYRALSDEEEARRKKSLSTLDEKIGFSTKPRLDALLLVAGIFDADVSVLGGNALGGGVRGGGFGAVIR